MNFITSVFVPNSFFPKDVSSVRITIEDRGIWKLHKLLFKKKKKKLKGIVKARDLGAKDRKMQTVHSGTQASVTAQGEWNALGFSVSVPLCYQDSPPVSNDPIMSPRLSEVCALCSCLERHRGLEKHTEAWKPEPQPLTHQGCSAGSITLASLKNTTMWYYSFIKTISWAGLFMWIKIKHCVSELCHN